MGQKRPRAKKSNRVRRQMKLQLHASLQTVTQYPFLMKFPVDIILKTTWPIGLLPLARSQQFLSFPGSKSHRSQRTPEQTLGVPGRQSDPRIRGWCHQIGWRSQEQVEEGTWEWWPPQDGHSVAGILQFGRSWSCPDQWIYHPWKGSLRVQQSFHLEETDKYS